MPNPVSPPTLYSEEKLKAAKEYLQECIDNNDIPFVEQLAERLGTHRDTIYEWIKPEHNYTELSDTIKRIHNVQRFMLQKGGLLGDYNPASSIFQLKANHGMVETSRTEHTGKDGSPLPILGALTQNVPSNNGDTETSSTD